MSTTQPKTSAGVSTDADVIVIGGGAAGLATGLVLGRARRSVLVIDAGEPRNAPAAHMHSYLTRDGMPPAEFLAAARGEVESYGGRILRGTVASVERREDGTFAVALESGERYSARRVVVTTGLLDVLPNIPGLREGWGDYVVHCPYCHGYEFRDRAIGIITTAHAIVLHSAQLWRQLSDNVTVFLHETGRFSDADREALDARGIRVVEGEIAAIEAPGGQLAGVRMRDGRLIAVNAVVSPTNMQARAGFLERLGLETVEQRMGDAVAGAYIPADAMGQTSVPGLYVAGNVANVSDQVISAAAAGNRVGAVVNADLVAEEVRAAVAAHSASGKEALAV